MPELARRQSCVMVETGDGAGGEMLALDLGNGAMSGMLAAGLSPFAVDRIFISHFHPDHTTDLPPLLFSMNYGAEEPRERPLRLYGPEPFRQFWAALLAVWGEWMVADYPLSVEELPLDTGRSEPVTGDGYSVSWRPVSHRPESIGYRIEDSGRSFVYTGDTGYCESVVELAQGADLLLIECTHSLDQETIPGHLNPEGVARIANKAGVKRVILTHFPTMEADLAAEVRRCGYTGEVLCARDGLQLQV